MTDLNDVIERLTNLRDKFKEMGDGGAVGGYLTTVYLSDCIRDLETLRDEQQNDLPDN